MPKDMTEEQYYTAPSQSVFDEIKEAAIAIWQTYDNTHGYVDEKVGRIKELTNVQDNAWYMVAMFDMSNQRKLMNMVSEETRALIEDAIGYLEE